MKNKVFTNCFLIQSDKTGKPIKVCLAMKKRGFGVGMWNGSGGKPQEVESVSQASIREVEEELGVKVIQMAKYAEIDFILQKEETLVKMHAFLVTDWQGELQETEEMKPEWFDIENIPYDKMWQADRQWLPLIFSGKKIKACYTYACEGGEVETSEINEMDTFG